MLYPKGSALFPYNSARRSSRCPTGFIRSGWSRCWTAARAATQDRAGFPAQQVRSETGIGASGASGH